MAKHTFTANEEWPFDFDGKPAAGFYCLVYSVTGAGLSGGTLRVYATIDGIKAPVPNSKLTAAKNDDNGDLVQMMIFSTAGQISVALAGAGASPNVTVAVR